jgi:CubicO group peptidase (beta-lactamase class C family)
MSTLEIEDERSGASCPPQHPDCMSLAREIDTIVTDAIARRIFPGAVVLVACGDAIRHYAAYGSTMYEAPGSQPVDIDTIYDVASLTKVFTATAALRLLDQGLLALDAPIGRYLPEVQAPNITIFQLLTHTSGLDIRLSALRHTGRAGVLDAVYRATPVQPPGTAVAYTNVNSLLLGEIVARLCGQPLDRAMEVLVIEPLGLRDTCFCPPPGLLPRIAPTEIDEGWRGALVHGSVHDESAYALGGVAGHAGLFSTAADLLVFCWAWLDDQQSREDGGWRMEDGGWKLEARGGCPVSLPASSPLSRLLSRTTAHLACTNHTSGLQMACGLGWMIDRPNFMGEAPPGTFGHTGFTGPAIVVVPERRLVIVVLNNRVYPRRQPPEHHAVIGAIVRATLRDTIV